MAVLRQQVRIGERIYIEVRIAVSSQVYEQRSLLESRGGDGFQVWDGGQKGRRFASSDGVRICRARDKIKGAISVSIAGFG